MYQILILILPLWIVLGLLMINRLLFGWAFIGKLGEKFDESCQNLCSSSIPLGINCSISPLNTVNNHKQDKNQNIGFNFLYFS